MEIYLIKLLMIYQKVLIIDTRQAKLIYRSILIWYVCHVVTARITQPHAGLLSAKRSCDECIFKPLHHASRGPSSPTFSIPTIY
jgi:hypothetical protein